MVHIVKGGHDFGNAPLLIIMIGDFNLAAQRFLLGLHRFMHFAAAVTQFIMKNPMAELTNDVFLIECRMQFGGSIKGGNPAIRVNRKGANVQIIQGRAQLFVKNQVIFLGSLSGHNSILYPAMPY